MEQPKNLPRIVFAGTPEFAATSLRELLLVGYPIALVLTVPDKRAGRGLKIKPNPVKILAEQSHIPIFQPIKLDTDCVENTLIDADAKILVVAAYGKILPSRILKIFKKGCINVHASLLPRWRGAAPIERAILAGDKETGISIMHMEKGLDTGPVYLEKREKIRPDDTAGSLEQRLRVLGAGALVQYLNTTVVAGPIKPTPQQTENITYAHKITKLESKIEWKNSASQINKLIRALSPKIGATTLLQGRVLKIWRASAREGPRYDTPGTIEIEKSGSVLVHCGSGLLSIEDLQIQGKRRMKAENFLKGAGNIHGKIMGN